MPLKYDLFEIMASAIMLNPVVIVEGKDDYQIYSNIIKLIHKKIDVYQVNQFENYSAGCENVIDCIRILQDKFAEREDNVHKLLGIIDRDSRIYRNTLPSNLLGLFVTKFYSIETYFVSSNVLKGLISKMTYVTEEDVNDELVEIINREFDILADELYVISLEALKNACTLEYNALVSYETAEASVVSKNSREYLMNSLLVKNEALSEFAAEKNVSKSDLKLIAKGKWYLYAVAYVATKVITGFKKSCEIGEIQQCKSCVVGNFNDCLLNRKQSNYSVESVRNMMMEVIDLRELSDLVEVLNSLK